MRATTLRSRILPGIALLLLAAFIVVVLPSEARAVVYSPTRFDDPPPDGCAANDCSLREAIMDASASLGVSDEVVLKAGTYQLTIPGSEEDGSMNGDLDIANDALTITGAGPGSTIIDGGGGTTSERVFNVISSATIRGMTIRNSLDFERAGIWGGDESILTVDNVVVTDHINASGGYIAGIFSEGTLTVTNSTVSNNRAGASCCAGVIQLLDGADGPLGTLTIRNSTVSGNEADPGAAGCCVGVYTQTDQAVALDTVTVTNNRSPDQDNAGITIEGTGPATISNSLVAGNVSEVCCAGIILESGSPSTITGTTVTGNTTGACCSGIRNDRALVVTNTTVSGNTAGGCCAGLYHDALGGTPMTVNNVTVTGNRASGDTTGGISNDGSGIVMVANSISFGNNAAPMGSDCSGDITSQGYNLFGVVNTCTIAGDTTGNLIGVDPMLGPLTANGGPTTTHALPKGSPALNAGNPTISRGGPGCETTDQRGLPRKDCDIGAYEQVLCGKVPVNVIGSDGKDKLRGTGAADGLYGLGGKDTLNGAGGKDGLCGGKGKDTLKGGGGKDFLNGEQGKDTCIGGGGRDKAKCEKEKKI